jgi:hypothetical protein
MDRGLNLNHVVFLTSSKQIQHLLIRVGYHWIDRVKHRDETIKQFCIFGQLDHRKPIDRFAIGRLRKGK